MTTEQNERSTVDLQKCSHIISGLSLAIESNVGIMHYDREMALSKTNQLYILKTAAQLPNHPNFHTYNYSERKGFGFQWNNAFKIVLITKMNFH